MSSNSAGSSSKDKGPSASLAAGKAIGHGFGKVGGAMMKTLVDVPLAMADGLHNVPALYGEEVRDMGSVRGWKSGGTKGLKVCIPHILHCVLDESPDNQIEFCIWFLGRLHRSFHSTISRSEERGSTWICEGSWYWNSGFLVS